MSASHDVWTALLPLAGVMLGASLTKADAREGRRYDRRAEIYISLLAQAAHMRENSNRSELPPRDEHEYKLLVASVEAFASDKARELWWEFNTRVSQAIGMQQSIDVYDRNGMNQSATTEVVGLMQRRNEALTRAETLFNDLESQVREELAAGGGSRRWRRIMPARLRRRLEQG